MWDQGSAPKKPNRFTELRKIVASTKYPHFGDDWDPDLDIETENASCFDFAQLASKSLELHQTPIYSDYGDTPTLSYRLPLHSLLAAVLVERDSPRTATGALVRPSSKFNSYCCVVCTFSLPPAATLGHWQTQSLAWTHWIRTQPHLVLWVTSSLVFCLVTRCPSRDQHEWSP